MAYKDLGEFISKLEEQGELVRIKTLVDPELEITEITDRVSKMHGPALLFENVKGSSMPVLINAFGSERRMAMSLGAKNLDDIGTEISDWLALKDNLPSSMVDKLKMLPKLAELSSLMPRTVKKAPCQEVLHLEPSLDILPVLKCWPGDAGRFITLPQVYTRDPKTGQRNAGMYRLQIFDKQTTGMHWHTHHDGADNYRKNQEIGRAHV